MSGRKPTLLGGEHEPRIRELRKQGRGVDFISSTMSLPRKQVQTLLEHIAREERGNWKMAPPPVEEADWTPRQRAEAHCRWMKDQLDAAVNGGAGVKEVASLSSQYVAAQRLVATLSGALDITEAQIIRSTAFARCLAALERACGDNREVWERWEKEVAELVGEGHG